MSKLKGIAKKSICILLASFVLMMTLVDSYVGAVPCYATELAAFGLYDAMSALMASMGFSVTTSGDRQAAAQSIYDSITKTFEGYEGDANQKYRDAFDKILANAYVSGKLIFDQEVDTAKDVWTAIKGWAKGLFTKSKAVDVFKYSDALTIHAMSGPPTAQLINSLYQFQYTDGATIAKQVEGYKYWAILCYGASFEIMYANTLSCYSYPERRVYTSDVFDLNLLKGNVWSNISFEGGDKYYYSRRDCSVNNIDGYDICTSTSTHWYIGNIPIQGFDLSSTSVSDQLALGEEATVDISDNLRSVADAGHTYDVITPTNTYDAETGVIGGTTTIPIDGTVTEKVKAVDSTAGTVAGTDQAIADALSELAAGQEEVAESLDDVKGILTTIYNTLKKSVVVPIGQIVDGTSALKEDAGTIADQFEVIDGGGQQDPEDDNEPGWLPFLPPMPKFMTNFANFLTTPLQKIINRLNDIKDSVTQLPQIITEQGLSLGNIVSSLSSIGLTVGAVKQLLEGIPDAIAQKFEIPDYSDMLEILPRIEGAITSLPDKLADAIEIPEINFPEIPDYRGLLEQMLDFLKNLPKLGNIQQLLEDIFVLDTSAISEALNEFLDVWDFHFLEDIKTLFTDHTFSDDVTYPVIKIKRPNVFASFYEENYIVLCDFGKYKEQLIWCRNLVRCMVWVYFAYSIFRHFKVRLSLS